MSKVSIFMVGIFFLAFIRSTASQPSQIDLNPAIIACQNDLVAAGLENIEIRVAPGPLLWIAYENRRFRNEVIALGVVLNSAVQRFPFSIKFILVPKYRNIPIKHIAVDRNRFEQWINDQISLDEFLADIAITWQPASPAPYAGYSTPQVQSSSFKLDLSFIPGCKAQFALPGDPAQLQFSLTGNVSLTLARGAQLNGQLFTPIYDEFQQPGRRAHLGSVQIQQFIRLPRHSFLSLSAGSFELGCAGISSQLKHYVWRDRLSMSFRADWIDTHSIDQWLLLSQPVTNRWSYIFQTDYRFEPLDFRVRLSWGRYLLGDSGWRIDVMRRFHELELEFMGVWSKSLEFLTGMTVRVPFPIARQAAPSRVRVTFPSSIGWQYRYLPCYDGLILNTGESFDAMADQLTLSFIRANSKHLKNARRYVHFDKPNFQFEELAGRGN